MAPAAPLHTADQASERLSLRQLLHLSKAACTNQVVLLSPRDWQDQIVGRGCSARVRHPQSMTICLSLTPKNYQATHGPQCSTCCLGACSGLHYMYPLTTSAGLEITVIHQPEEDSAAGGRPAAALCCLCWGSRKGLACSGGAKGFDVSTSSSSCDPDARLSWGNEPLDRKGLDSTCHAHTAQPSTFTQLYS